ncbi:MAG: flavodoxin [Paludibacteraceae bacterium]|nr:flavodoxin [Paludibacteraceae bacterium]
MNKLKSIILAVSALLIGVSSSGQTTKNQTNMGKSIVIFFSHAGENYAVGNIKVGNTKIVADYISEFTGATQFEIVPDKNYDMPYSELIKVAKDETNKGELPSYKGKIDNIDQYDVIFIGGPIWWGTYPQVMFTFFKDYDLNGKTIVPFTTHEGSGLGSVVSDLKQAYPRAKFAQSFSIYGHEVRTGKEKVEKWVKGLQY